MKAILEFNLPEEQTEFDAAVNAGGYIQVLNTLDTELRRMGKYDAYPPEWDNCNQASKILAHIRMLISNYCQDEGVSII
jgi:hypothetical protein